LGHDEGELAVLGLVADAGQLLSLRLGLGLVGGLLGGRGGVRRGGRGGALVAVREDRGDDQDREDHTSDDEELASLARLAVVRLRRGNGHAFPFELWWVSREPSRLLLMAGRAAPGWGKRPPPARGLLERAVGPAPVGLDRERLGDLLAIGSVGPVVGGRHDSLVAVVVQSERVAE